AEGRCQDDDDRVANAQPAKKSRYPRPLDGRQRLRYEAFLAWLFVAGGPSVGRPIEEAEEGVISSPPRSAVGGIRRGGCKAVGECGGLVRGLCATRIGLIRGQMVASDQLRKRAIDRVPVILTRQCHRPPS